MTYSNWLAEKAWRSMPPPSPPSIDLPLHPRPVKADRMRLTDVACTKHRNRSNMDPFENQSDEERLTLATKHRTGIAVCSPAPRRPSTIRAIDHGGIAQRSSRGSQA